MRRDGSDEAPHAGRTTKCGGEEGEKRGRRGECQGRCKRGSQVDSDSLVARSGAQGVCVCVLTAGVRALTRVPALARSGVHSSEGCCPQ
eukprot:1663635-Prymnesium_polylepis.1